MAMLAVLMNQIRLKQRRRSSKPILTNLDCCRTCLSTEDLNPIFCGPESKDLLKSNALFTLTGLSIQANDGLPQTVCAKCDNLINAAAEFKRVSHKAHRELYNAVFKVKKDTVHIKQERNLDDNDDRTDAFDDNHFHDDDTAQVAKKPKTVKRKKPKEPKEYKCKECDKVFLVKNTYTTHMRLHTHFCICELCGKKCRNNNLLLLHKRGKHGAERVHKCTYCDYASANKEGLVIHERRHTGEKPYVCDHCGASFHRRSNLVQHIAIHLPDKNFQCTFCPKRLASRKLLQIHIHGAHTGPRYAYLCPACGRRFNKPNKVRAHVRSAHAAAPPERVARIELGKGGY